MHLSNDLPGSIIKMTEEPGRPEMKKRYAASGGVRNDYYLHCVSDIDLLLPSRFRPE